MDFALRRVLIPLTKLERFEAAATILGGLDAIPRSTPITRAALGSGFGAAFRAGQGLSLIELVRFAVDEVQRTLQGATW